MTVLILYVFYIYDMCLYLELTMHISPPRTKTHTVGQLTFKGLNRQIHSF